MNGGVGPWFRVVLKTVGLSGGVNYRQPYDRAQACVVCGVGAVPIGPLVAELSRMGKKQLDRTAHDGHVIVTTGLADALTREGLTGFELRPVRRAHLETPDTAYRWLHIVFEWPQTAPTTSFAIQDLCPRCERTGHFDLGARLDPWHYRQAPASAADFGLTWERFGIWRSKGWEPGVRGVGGQGGVIVSDRARGVLRAQRVRHLEFLPLVFGRGA